MQIADDYNIIYTEINVEMRCVFISTVHDKNETVCWLRTLKLIYLLTVWGSTSQYK